MNKKPDPAPPAAPDLRQQMVEAGNHFNNLLSVILGYASLVLNHEQVSADSELALKKIVETAQRGRRLTRSLLDLLGTPPPAAGSAAAPITLPLTGEPSAHRVRVRARPVPSLIWLADDDAIFCEMCRLVLGEEGHGIEVLSGGRALQDRWLNLPGGTKPDLLIIDFSMPDLNGRQLCEWLRAQGCRAPIILVSGFPDNQPDIARALKGPRMFFLQKPFTLPELTDTVTVALGETLLGE